MDQSTWGIPGPPGHMPMAPSTWQGRRCSWRAEVSTVNKYCFIPLSPCHLLPGHQWLLTSYPLMSQSCISKTLVPDHPLTPCTMVFDEQIQSSILPFCRDLPHISDSVSVVHKRMFLEFANGCDKPYNLSYWGRLGQYHCLSFPAFLPHADSEVFLLPWKMEEAVTFPGSVSSSQVHTWYNGRSKITTVSFLISEEEWLCLTYF